jgi:hypothetical protein
MSAHNLNSLSEQVHQIVRPCPVEGDGVHRWLLGSANRLVGFGLLTRETAEEIEGLLLGLMTRLPQPPCEVRSAIARALQDAGKDWVEDRPEVPAFKLEVAQALAGDCSDGLAKLKSLSPWPTDLTSSDYLRAIFPPGSQVCVVNAPTSRGQIYEPHGGESIPLTITWPCGVWFTCNSVFGLPVLNKTGKPSIRCADAIYQARYILLEVDREEVGLDMQASMIGRLKLPIVSVVTSGGKSLHALARISDGCREAWKEAQRHLKSTLPEIGFDPAAMTVERLTRLPGYRRSEKGPDVFQELVYLNPEADGQMSIFEKGGVA